MEASEPTPAKIRFGRWLWLASAVTVLLAAVVFWHSRREHLHYVEPIWSDSLPGHEGQTEHLGERRKVGEMWTLSRTTGVSLFGHGVSRRYCGQYPVFTTNHQFHLTLSEHMLDAHRDTEREFTELSWSNWWQGVTGSVFGGRWECHIDCEVLYLSDKAIVLRNRVRSSIDGSINHLRTYGMNFVKHHGEVEEVKVGDLFRNRDWMAAVADICHADLEKRGVIPVTKGVSLSERLRRHSGEALGCFTLSPERITFYFSPTILGSSEHQVVIPFKELDRHLRPDGPHRLFQARGIE